MDPKEIKKILELIEDTDIVELSWEKSGQKIGFRKKAEAVKNIGQEKSAEVENIKAAGANEVQPEDDLAKNYHTLKSNMVGTFYIAPTPDSPPYIQEGSKVKKGQKLAVVEAMKIMKEILSDSEGKVIKILVENGHHVEYGQPLFSIELNQEPKNV